MKRVVSALLLLFSSQALVAAEPAAKTFTVGIVPQFDANKLHAIWQPILEHVQQQTGYQMVLKGTPSISEFEKAFSAGAFDFAYMNPYHLIMANNAAGYVPLVRDRGRQLFGVLVVRKDSPIQQPSELKGKTVAFPSPNALGASLQMRQELHDKFGVDVVPNYVKTHDSVYLNVLLGEAAAGGGVQKTLNQQKPEYKEALRIIHTTEKVPPHPLAVLPSVPEEVRLKVQQALIALGETEDGKALLSKIPIQQVGAASLEEYEPLRKMGLERFVGTSDTE